MQSPNFLRCIDAHALVSFYAPIIGKRNFPNLVLVIGEREGFTTSHEVIVQLKLLQQPIEDSNESDLGFLRFSLSLCVLMYVCVLPC